MLQATVFYSNGMSSQDSVPEWSSRQPEIASPDDNGTFLGQAPGTATVQATFGGKTSTATIYVKEYLCDLHKDPYFGGQVVNDSVYSAYLKSRCHQDLGQPRLDTLKTIRNEANAWLRNPVSLPDSAARVQCERVIQAVDSLLRGGRESIWMGKDNSAGSNGTHNAQAGQGTGQMHFDPAYWNANSGSTSGRRKIFRTLMHEAVHGLLETPGQPTHAEGSNPNYSNYPYFKFIESSNQNSCLIP
jgi:hypothetical protein